MRDIKRIMLKSIKLLIFCMTITLSVSANLASAKGTAINKKNFSTNMINYVSHKFDKNNDGYLSNKEIKKARKLEFDGDETVQVFDFRGLDKLTYLDEIACECTEFRNFSLDALKRIKKLSLHDCKIRQLDFEKMPLLEEANIYYVDTKSDYNFKKNIRLKSLDIRGCNVKKLDLKNQKKLVELSINCEKCYSLKLPLVKKLQKLHIDAPITYFDPSRIPNIRELMISAVIEHLDFENNKKLKSLYVESKDIVHELALLTEVTGLEGLTALEELTMVNCPVELFNDMHPKLREIHFINCQLSEIDVTDLPALYRIDVDKSDVFNFYSGEKNTMLESVSFTNCRKLENVVIKRLNNMNSFSYVCNKKQNEPVLKTKEAVWNQETGQVTILEGTINLGINYAADSNE